MRPGDNINPISSSSIWLRPQENMKNHSSNDKFLSRPTMDQTKKGGRKKQRGKKQQLKQLEGVLLIQRHGHAPASGSQNSKSSASSRHSAANSTAARLGARREPKPDGRPLGPSNQQKKRRPTLQNGPSKLMNWIIFLQENEFLGRFPCSPKWGKCPF